MKIRAPTSLIKTLSALQIRRSNSQIGPPASQIGFPASQKFGLKIMMTG